MNPLLQIQQVIPDSISGLNNLDELNVSTNVLESLPYSIGLLQKLKILNVAGNKLTNPSFAPVHGESSSFS